MSRPFSKTKFEAKDGGKFPAHMSNASDLMAKTDNGPCRDLDLADLRQRIEDLDGFPAAQAALRRELAFRMRQGHRKTA